MTFTDHWEKCKTKTKRERLGRDLQIKCGGRAEKRENFWLESGCGG